MRDLKIIVKEIKGECDIMKVGDYCVVRGSRLTIPESTHFCLWALQSILPLIPAKQRTIVELNDWLHDAWEIECPIPRGRSSFKWCQLMPNHKPLSTYGAARCFILGSTG